MLDLYTSVHVHHKSQQVRSQTVFERNGGFFGRGGHLGAVFGDAHLGHHGGKTLLGKFVRVGTRPPDQLPTGPGSKMLGGGGGGVTQCLNFKQRLKEKIVGVETTLSQGQVVHGGTMLGH